MNTYVDNTSVLVCELFILESERGTTCGIQVRCVGRHPVRNGGERREEFDITAYEED